MSKRKFNITKMWKFYFWLIVWTSVFIPSFFYPILLDGVWLILARALGVVLFFYSMFLASSGGRTLAKFGHKDEHETFWPDKFQAVGIFSCMRHPMHLGLAIFPVAVTLISGYVLAIVTSGWGVAAAFWFVVYIEEKDTMEKYAGTYPEYIKTVPPFSLSIRCVKEAFKLWNSKRVE